MMGTLVFVRDGRTLPFVPVTTAALEAIAAAVPPRRLAYARSLYLALLELANADRTDRVAITRKILGERSGCSRDLVTDLRPALEAAGVVHVHERVHAGQTLEHEWVVVEPEEHSDGGAVNRTPVASSHDPLGHEPRLSLEDEERTEEETRARGSDLALVEAPGHDVPNWTYDGKRVPMETRRAALALLGAYAEASGQGIMPFRANGKASDHLTRITGALLDHPDVSAERWEAMLRWRVENLPSYVRDGTPSVGVVFGPRVVERNLAEFAAPRRAAGGHGSMVARGDAVLATMMGGR